MLTQSKYADPPRRTWFGCGMPSGRQMLWAIVFGVTLSFGIALLRHLKLPPAAQYLIPAVPLAAGFLYMRAMVADIQKQMDELQLRIYFEASAVVVCGLFILMLVYPLLEAAHLVGPLDSFLVTALIVVLALAGYVRAWRRYR